MLQEIKIRNFALIEKTEIPFEKGLNVLSGETGAGKSIVLEAISLLLGGRAQAGGIRSGAEEAVVEGLFDLSELPVFRERLQTLGVECPGEELVIKRTINRSGKNRIFMNGGLATLNMLSAACEGLIDLCGQHEHQSLFRASVQLDLLDRFAGIENHRAGASSRFALASRLREERETLKKKEEERAQRLAFLQFQIGELREANLVAGEDESLAHEKKLLQSSEQRLQLAGQIESALDAEEGAFSSLKLATNRARALVQIDEAARGIHEAMERALAEIEEGARLVRQYRDGTDLNPGRLQEVQERLSLLANLKRKYGATLDGILANLEKLESENELLLNLGTRLDSIEAEFQKECRELLALARALFEKREKGARSFMKAVSQELRELRMQDAEVGLSLSFGEEIASWGADSLGTSIELLVRTNLGEEKKPIQKIISGGELSRLMLAIRRVIADRGGIGVYLFDEIDAGLGGQTAFTVGKKLKSVARHNQVICITHVPQVACFADHHLSISKHSLQGRTTTRVVVLDEAGRREEIARMLGAEKLTPSAIKNARELMDSASV